jgi:hypothetical protein
MPTADQREVSAPAALYAIAAGPGANSAAHRPQAPTAAQSAPARQPRRDAGDQRRIVGRRRRLDVGRTTARSAKPPSRNASAASAASAGHARRARVAEAGAPCAARRMRSGAAGA